MEVKPDWVLRRGGTGVKKQMKVGITAGGGVLRGDDGRPSLCQAVVERDK